MLAFGVLVAANVVPGIHCSSVGSLLVAAALLGLINALVRPVLLLVSLPFIIFTMGLGVLVINAILFLLVGNLVQGFYISGFWSALGGSVVLGLTNILMGAVMRPPRPPRRGPPASGPGAGGDVIDI